MDNYEEQSDFEINKAVAEALGFELSNYFGPDYGYYKIDNREHSALARVSDYCNNPSDAWPIITENRINLICWEHANGVWKASNTMKVIPDKDSGEYEIPHENPLRAAMIVFLLMQEAK